MTPDEVQIIVFVLTALVGLVLLFAQVRLFYYLPQIHSELARLRYELKKRAEAKAEIEP